LVREIGRVRGVEERSLWLLCPKQLLFLVNFLFWLKAVDNGVMC